MQLLQAERHVRANLDACRISETRVTWLLEFNRALLDMRRVFTIIATQVDPYYTIASIIRSPTKSSTCCAWRRAAASRVCRRP